MSFALVVFCHVYCHVFVILDLVVVIILGRRGQGDRERREEPGAGERGWKEGVNSVGGGGGGGVGAVGAGHPK